MSRSRGANQCGGGMMIAMGDGGHAEAAVIEEAGERAPAFEAVVDRFADLTVLGDPGALHAQPVLQLDHKRPAALIAHVDPLLWHHAVDLALDGEQDIDTLD